MMRECMGRECYFFGVSLRELRLILFNSCELEEVMYFLMGIENYKESSFIKDSPTSFSLYGQ